MISVILALSEWRQRNDAHNCLVEDSMQTRSQPEESIKIYTVVLQRIYNGTKSLQTSEESNNPVYKPTSCSQC